MPETLDRSLSLDSVPEDDWDHSHPDPKDNGTPRNSIVFPVNETPGKSSKYTHNSVQDTENGKGNRTLSELLRLHSEKDSKGNISPEEATRIADVLGQWVGIHPCPVLELHPDISCRLTLPLHLTKLKTTFLYLLASQWTIFPSSQSDRRRLISVLDVHGVEANAPSHLLIRGLLVLRVLSLHECSYWALLARLFLCYLFTLSLCATPPSLLLLLTIIHVLLMTWHDSDDNPMIIYYVLHLLSNKAFSSSAI